MDDEEEHASGAQYEKRDEKMEVCYFLLFIVLLFALLFNDYLIGELFLDFYYDFKGDKVNYVIFT